MVQVDVFWTYALGASFAAAAGRQLEEEPRTFDNPYFTRLLLFLSILFVPSGAVLLWAFPSWETMHAGDRSLPAWLVLLFNVTNVTQGILGFWVAHRLVRTGRLFAAHIQWIAGYFLMFFILVHGWDGTGYLRFFYPGSHEQWVAKEQIPIYRFFWSEVALTLYGFGVVILPILFAAMSKWMKDGYGLGSVDGERAARTSRLDLTRTLLRLMWVWTLGSVIVLSILIHLLGWIAGVLVFVPLFAYLGFRPGNGIFVKEIGRLTLEPRAAAARAPGLARAVP